MEKKAEAIIAHDESPFIDAIVENPQDDHLRLVYADWLEEHGDRRCDYLRMECEFAELARKISPDYPELANASRERLAELRQQISELRRELHDGWLSLVSRSPIACCPSTVRLEFECPKTWDQLQLTQKLRVRHCNACNSNVYFETSEKAALKRAANGDCVCLVADLEPHGKYQQQFDEAGARQYILGGFGFPHLDEPEP